MPNILFASNNLSHFPTAAADSNTAYYDDNRVPYAVHILRGQVVNSPVFLPSSGDETWFHARFRFNSISTRQTDKILRFYDANDNLLLDMSKTYENGGTSAAATVTLYDGASSQSFGISTPPAYNFNQWFDVKFRITSLLIEVEVYLNSAIVGSRSFNSNPSGYGHPVRFSLGGGYGNGANGIRWSEIIVADGDTRNARLNLLRPLAAGAYEQWDGQLGTLADDDTTTGLTTIAADQRHTMTMSPYLGAPNISNVVTVSATTRGQNSPTKLQHSIRLSGVDYDSPVIHDIGFPLEFQISDYQFNPATSLPWTSDDLTAIETGFVSRA